MEQEAVDFYMKCALKTNTRAVKKRFPSIVDEEKCHIICVAKAI